MNLALKFATIHKPKTRIHGNSHCMGPGPGQGRVDRRSAINYAELFSVLQDKDRDRGQ